MLEQFLAKPFADANKVDATFVALTEAKVLYEIQSFTAYCMNYVELECIRQNSLIV